MKHEGMKHEQTNKSFAR